MTEKKAGIAGIAEKKKMVTFEDGKLKISFQKEFDTNNDGEPLGKIEMNVEVDLMEIPDEAYDAWMNRKK